MYVLTFIAGYWYQVILSVQSSAKKEQPSVKLQLNAKPGW